MSKTITLSFDEEHRDKLSKLEKIMKKPKSQIFRDMITYFFDRKEKLCNGIYIEIGDN